MATYVAQRNESFNGNLINLPVYRRMLPVCGDSILTKEKENYYDVFNYSGMHSLFVAVAKVILFYRS